MCGIIGYIGNKNVVPLLIDGLKKLEYRGYDSAGICVSDGTEINIVKNVGKITKLEKRQELNKLKGSIGIAHTRWATHGEPNEINAHPHFDCKGDISIVHNGIIENYQALKDLLEKEGHNIISETDSEIIAHLIEKFYSGNIEDAVIKALNNLEGTFGLLIIHRDEEKIIAARRGSPLIIGLGKNETIVASDAVAILSHTKRVVYLQDNEISIIDKDGFAIKNLAGKKVDKKVQEIKWNIDEIEKKGYKHFMLKEIFEQPEAVANTLRGRIKNGKIKLSIDLDLNKLNRILITACGTSWHSALIGKYIIENLVNIPVEVDYASEFRYRNTLVNKDDLMIVISQSGETADTLAALLKAKSEGAKTIGLVNVVGSTIAREVDSGIYIHAGPEIGVASTKAFLCQVSALLIIALYIKQQKGMVLDQDLLKALKNIPDKIATTLKQSEEIKKIAVQFKDRKNFLYLGRGMNFPVALEGALKLKEISYIHAEGYPAAEMKHGPIALIDENIPVVFLATRGLVFDKVLSNMQEVKARKGIIITVTDNRDKSIQRLSDYVINVPETIEELSPLINVIPLQFLAYYIADMKGLNVDKPRNLAKSVTVE